MNMQCKLERTVHLHFIFNDKWKDASVDVLHHTCWQRNEQTTYDGTHSAPNDITTHYDLTKHQHLQFILYGKWINKSISVEELVSGDKNAILTFLRITGYGPEYEVEIDCPGCGDTIKHEFDLSKLTMRFLDVSPVAPGENRFSFHTTKRRRK